MGNGSWGVAIAGDGCALPSLEEREAAALDAVPRFRIRKGRIAKCSVRHTHGPGSIAVVELEQHHFIPRQMGEVPPAMIWVVVKYRGRDQRVLVGHVAKH